MLIKKITICIFLLTALVFYLSPSYAVIPPIPPIGQVVEIRTDLRSFVGRPSWLLVLRDLDSNTVIPYLFEFMHGKNAWIAFTPGRNYLITISNLQFSPYHRLPFYYSKRTNNFCHLESHGRIIRNQSIRVFITGHLSPNTSTYSCVAVRYKNLNFVVDP